MTFLLAFAAGIGIICSMAGWGWLTIRAIRVRLSTGIGCNAAVGLALSTTIGGLLNVFHIITPAVVRTYLLGGFLLAAFVAVTQAGWLCSSVMSSWTYFRPRKLIAFGALLLLALALVKYATAVSPGQFHPQDDYHAYLVFPVKMIQTGSLGPDPFSERRIVSSLGGKAFLDTFPLSLTGEVRNLHLMDAGVAFIILLLLLAEIMMRRNIPGHWMVLTLLAAALFAAPVSNITALYSGVVLLVLLFDFLDRTATQASIAQAGLMAIVLASLASLKSTFALAGGVFFLTYFIIQLRQLPFSGKTVARAGLCAILTVLCLLPWMLDSYTESGTLFYPFLGKGFHGSRYGTYLLPTARMGMRNILAFLHGIANTLCAVLAIEAVLVLLRRRWNDQDWLIEIAIVLNAVIGVLIVGIGTAGLQVYRYSFAVTFSAVLFLLIKGLGVLKPGSPFNSYGSAAAVLLLGLLLGTGWDAFMTEQQEWRLAALKFSLTGENIVSASEVSAYRNMQDSIPPGQKVLVRLDNNFLLDFRRNLIYINDLPGGASLPPGIPIFKGSEALADYLVHHGIRYLAYSYGDEATFSRARFSDRLKPYVNVWIRVGAQIAFDFQDNVVSLGRTRKRLFDNGRMFALDLAAKVPPTGYDHGTRQ
jgi:hypothetical protein